jgi:cell division topological specificity factor
MNILARLFGKRKGSKEMAKQRLRLVLVHDRSGIPPELLQVIKNEIITVISKHVWVDRDAIEMTLSHQQGHTRLEADIPIASLRPGTDPSRAVQGDLPGQGATEL